MGNPYQAFDNYERDFTDRFLFFPSFPFRFDWRMAKAPLRIKLITFDAYNTLFKPKGSLSAQYVCGSVPQTTITASLFPEIGARGGQVWSACVQS